MNERLQDREPLTLGEIAERAKVTPGTVTAMLFRGDVDHASPEDLMRRVAEYNARRVTGEGAILGISAGEVQWGLMGGMPGPYLIRDIDERVCGIARDDLCAVEQAAERSGKSADQLDNMMELGTLETETVGGLYYVTVASLAAALGVEE